MLLCSLLCIPPMDIHEIVPRLFLGSWLAAENLETLKQHSITHVLIAAYELTPVFPKHFTYLKLDIADDKHEDLIAHLDLCWKFIDEGVRDGNAVFCHCRAGISRSPTIVAAYLMLKEHCSAEEALQTVRSRRPSADPNNSFRRQLQWLEDSLLCQIPLDQHIFYASFQRLYEIYKYARQLAISNKLPHKLFQTVSPPTSQLDTTLARAQPLQVEPTVNSNSSGDATIRTTESHNYWCARCRSVLFSEDSVLYHQPPKLPTRRSAYTLHTDCNTIFIQPQRWMIPFTAFSAKGCEGDSEWVCFDNLGQLRETHGDLRCPSCAQTIGCWDWLGNGCSCGHPMEPAFIIRRDAVLSPLLQCTRLFSHLTHMSANHKEAPLGSGLHVRLADR